MRRWFSRERVERRVPQGCHFFAYGRCEVGSDLTLHVSADADLTLVAAALRQMADDIDVEIELNQILKGND